MTQKRRAFDVNSKMTVVWMIKDQGLSVGQHAREYESGRNSSTALVKPKNRS